jgi:hypothetical protein
LLHSNLLAKFELPQLRFGATNQGTLVFEIKRRSTPRLLEFMNVSRHLAKLDSYLSHIQSSGFLGPPPPPP